MAVKSIVGKDGRQWKFYPWDPGDPTLEDVLAEMGASRTADGKVWLGAENGTFALCPKHAILVGKEDVRVELLETIDEHYQEERPVPPPAPPLPPVPPTIGTIPRYVHPASVGVGDVAPTKVGGRPEGG